MQACCRPREGSEVKKDKKFAFLRMKMYQNCVEIYRRQISVAVQWPTVVWRFQREGHWGATRNPWIWPFRCYFGAICMSRMWHPNVLHCEIRYNKRRHFASLRPRQRMRIIDEGSGYDVKQTDALCVRFESNFIFRHEYVYVGASSLSLRLCLCIW